MHHRKMGPGLVQAMGKSEHPLPLLGRWERRNRGGSLALGWAMGPFTACTDLHQHSNHSRKVEDADAAAPQRMEPLPFCMPSRRFASALWAFIGGGGVEKAVPGGFSHVYHLTMLNKATIPPCQAAMMPLRDERVGILTYNLGLCSAFLGPLSAPTFPAVGPRSSEQGEGEMAHQ